MTEQSDKGIAAFIDTVSDQSAESSSMTDCIRVPVITLKQWRAHVEALEAENVDLRSNRTQSVDTCDHIADTGKMVQQVAEAVNKMQSLIERTATLEAEQVALNQLAAETRHTLLEDYRTAIERISVLEAENYDLLEQMTVAHHIINTLRANT